MDQPVSYDNTFYDCLVEPKLISNLTWHLLLVLGLGNTKDRNPPASLEGKSLYTFGSLPSLSLASQRSKYKEKIEMISWKRQRGRSVSYDPIILSLKGMITHCGKEAVGVSPVTPLFATHCQKKNIKKKSSCQWDVQRLAWVASMFIASTCVFRNLLELNPCVLWSILPR